jgi:hypothetical protein
MSILPFYIYGNNLLNIYDCFGGGNQWERGGEKESVMGR